MSISAFSAISSIPGLGASQSPANVFGNPSQQIQYFSQGQSNPPGQTVDLVLRNLNAIYSIWGSVLQNPSYSTDLSANEVPNQTTITSTLSIIKAVREGILTRFSLYQQWFSANSPYKGYASNNAINSCFSQLNVYPVSQLSGASLSATYLGRLAFNLVSAQYNDLENYTTQINRYAYRFIAAKTTVTTTNYNNVTETLTVAEWFSVIWQQLSVNTQAYKNGGGVYSGLYWDFSFDVGQVSYTLLGLDSIYGLFSTNCVFIESIIPVFFKVLPDTAIASSQLSSIANTYYSFIYMTFSVLLLKQLQALTIGFLKVKDLTDSSGNLIFSDAAGYISAAASTYANSFVTFTTATGISQTVGNNTLGPFINLDFFSQANTAGALDARNASVDPNRIPGSLIPTLQFQIDIIDALNSVYNDTYFQAVLLTNQVSILYQNIEKLQTALIPTRADIQLAIDSFGSDQLSIHYGRWPFYMGTI
jgi:hypothetical protein